MLSTGISLTTTEVSGNIVGEKRWEVLPVRLLVGRSDAVVVSVDNMDYEAFKCS